MSRTGHRPLAALRRVAVVMAGSLLMGAALPALAQTAGQPGVPAQGETPPQPTEAQMAQMRRDVQTAASYTLPRDFLTRMRATLQALRAANLQPPPGDPLSLEATIARVQKVAGVDAVMKSHGFTARDFVLGLTCFGMTVALTNNQQAASGQAPQLNPANVALIRSNPQETQALLQEMGAQPPQ